MLHNQHLGEFGKLFSNAGLEHIVICPGSRNAPLIQLFTSDDRFICHSMVDERAAGYTALGMSRQLGRPVAVLTTSGTAVLNLSPSIAEAYRLHLPLLALTTDRPPESIPVFNNQIIDQKEVFSSNSKGFMQVPAENADQEGLEGMIGEAWNLLQMSLAWPCGPVHFNFLLEEPLYETIPRPILDKAFWSRPGLQVSPAEPDSYSTADSGAQPDTAGHRDRQIEGRILILAGMGAGNGDEKSRKALIGLLEELTRCRNAVVVAENIANLSSDQFIAVPDLVIAGAGNTELEKMRPEHLVCFGGQLVSKRLKIFLQSHNTTLHEIDRDIEGFLGALCKGSAKNEVRGNVLGRETGTDEFRSAWMEQQDRITKILPGLTGSLEFSNLSAVNHIIQGLPGGTVLHLGNSGSIRYSQMLPLRRDLVYYSNRGTSGIDGSLSAAVGAAMVSDQFHVLILGDLSFVYDSNALWNRDFPENLRIIVLNDGGGGIFRIIDGPDSMEFFEEFSVTHHTVSIEMISNAFNRGALRAGSPAELEEALPKILHEKSGYCILEVDTTGCDNSSIFKSFIQQI